MKTIRDPKQLLVYLPQNDQIEIIIRAAEQAIDRGHDFAVTEYYLSNVIKGDARHPLLTTFLPSLDDLSVSTGDHLSLLGQKFSDSQYLIQKYKANAIIMLTDQCAGQKCVYCFRKKMGNLTIPITELDKIMDDLEKTDDTLMEILLSGGDPLMAKRTVLNHVAKRLSTLRKKVAIVINTRMPIVAPDLFDRELYELVAKINPYAIDLHILHPDEITAGFKEVCLNLYKISFPPPSLRTIHPLLNGINDNAQLLTKMYRELSNKLNIIPKDLIVPIPTGAGPRKRVSLERAMAIMRELSIFLPGHLLPRLSCCSPISGKSSIDPFHQKKNGEFGYDTDNGKIEGLYIKDCSTEQSVAAI